MVQTLWVRNLRCDARGGNGHNLFRHQKHMACARPILTPKVNGRIKGLSPEIKRSEPCRQVHSHFWVACGKVGETRRQPMHSKGRQDCQIEAATQRIGCCRNRGRSEPHQNITHMHHIIATSSGENQRTALAHKKSGPDLILECFELPADRALSLR